MSGSPRGKGPSAILAIALTASCVSAVPADDRDANGTLTTYLGASPTTIDPQISNGTPQVAIISHVFEPLLAFDPKTLQPVPAAAQELPTVSDDGLSYRFTLRDAKYSDGAPVRARDFAFAFTRLCDPVLDSGAPAFYAALAHLIVGCREWNTLDLATASTEQQRAARERLVTDGIRVNGERDIEFRLSEPARYFTAIVALWIGSPVREADVTRGGERWATDPATFIGNGPFVLESWRPEDRAVFVPNRYYREPPKIARWTKLMVKWTGDDELSAYRKGEVDVFYQYPRLSPEQRAMVDGDPAMRTERLDLSGSCTLYIGFNSRKPPFDEPDVRMAFAKALDRSTYVRDIENGIGAAALSFIPPGIPGHDGSDTIQAFDPTEARRLLAASGYQGHSALADLVIPYARTNEAIQRRLTWLRSQWKEHLGISVALEPLDAPVAAGRFRNVDTIPKIFLGAWCTDYPDPQNWLTFVFHSSTQFSSVRNAAFKDAEFDRLTTTADREADPARRAEMYLQAQRILTSTAAFAPYYYEGRRVYQKPWVRGVVHTPIDVDIGSVSRFKGMYVARRNAIREGGGAP